MLSARYSIHNTDPTDVVSVIGIFVYRGPFFGLFDTLHAINPWKYTEGADWRAYLVAVLTAFLIAQVHHLLSMPPTVISSCVHAFLLGDLSVHLL